MQRLTVADRLLIAAFHLGGDGRNAFTAEELVVAAWTRYPEAFGLRGILDDDGLPMYPDSNRVFAEIMGSKPLRRNGMLEKVGGKTYRLTEAGRQRAGVLSGRQSEPSARRSIDRGLQESLRRLMRSRANSKRQAGRMSDVTFLDACSFWGISPRSSAMDLEAKLAHVEATLREVQDYIAGGSVVLDRTSEASDSDVEQLMEMHGELQLAFADELAVIRKRRDER